MRGQIWQGSWDLYDGEGKLASPANTYISITRRGKEGRVRGY